MKKRGGGLSKRVNLISRREIDQFLRSARTMGRWFIGNRCLITRGVRGNDDRLFRQISKLGFNYILQRATSVAADFVINVAGCVVVGAAGGG